MFWIILPIRYTTAECLADNHNLSIDYYTRGAYGTQTLTGSRANVSEVRTLALIEGIEFQTNL